MKAKFSREQTFSDKKGKSSDREKAPRIDELVDIHKFKEKKWTAVRLVGPVFSYATHWVATVTKEGKPTKFPVPCLSWDDVSESHDSDKHCPYCESLPDGDQNNQTGKKPNLHYFVNAIIRSRQEREPKRNVLSESEEETGFCDPKSETEAWTAIQVLQLPAGVANQLHTLSETNLHGKKGGKKTAYPLSDPKYGCDLNIYFDNDKAPAQKYNVQKAEHTPLEENEEGYLMWNIEGLQVPESEESAEENVKRVLKALGEEGDDDEDDEDEEDDAPRRGKKGAKGKTAASKKPVKKGYDDDEDDEDDEDEDEEDDAPRRGAKKPAAKGRKPSRDDEDEDDEDEDEDEKPRRGAKKPAPKKTSRDEDEDDDDDDDGDDDEDEDEKPAKSKKPAGKRRPADEDEDDEDDDEDDEPRAKGKKPAAKPSKKSSRDDDDDDDDEDEEDDEKPARGKSKPASKGGKKPSRDDDDEDDEDEEDEDEDEKPAKGKKSSSKKPAPKRRRPSDDDDDEDEDED